jgi:hypothetical protein
MACWGRSLQDPGDSPLPALSGRVAWVFEETEGGDERGDPCCEGCWRRLP